MAEESAIDIAREDGPTGGRYRASVDGHVAEMTFSRASPRLIIIDHTEVPGALRGRGIGDRLVADGRSEGFKIFPLCPFAASQFRKHGDYGDVLSR